MCFIGQLDFNWIKNCIYECIVILFVSENTQKNFFKKSNEHKE